MTYVFKVTGHLRPTGHGKRVVKQTQDERRQICESCEWFQKNVSRCTRPNDKNWKVCYRSNLRVNPWIGILSCGNWQKHMIEK